MPPDAQLMVDTPTDSSTTSTHILALEACTEQTPPDAQHMVDKPCRNAKVAAGVLPKGRRNACCQHAPVGPGHGNLSIEHMFPCKYAQICLKRPAKHTCMHNRYAHTHTHTLPLTRTHTHAHAHTHARTHTHTHARTHTYQEQGIVKTLIRVHTQALSGGQQLLALRHAPIALQDRTAPLVSFLLLAPSCMHMFRCVHVRASVQTLTYTYTCICTSHRAALSRARFLRRWWSSCCRATARASSSARRCLR